MKERRKHKKRLSIFIIILLLIVVLVAVVNVLSWKDSYELEGKTEEMVFDTTYRDSLKKALHKEIENQMDEYRLPKDKHEDVRCAYIQTLEDVSDTCSLLPASGEDCQYFLFDITQDGIPELWIIAGTSHATTIFNAYTFRNNKAECLHEGFGCCSWFHLNRDEHYVVQLYDHMSYTLELKHSFDGDKMRTDTILEYSDYVFDDEAHKKYDDRIKSTTYDEKEVETFQYPDVMPILTMFE